jgi:arsenate reductase
MLVLGLQGSPMLKGSTSYLLDMFLSHMATYGARTERVDVSQKNIHPCKGCGYCEKNGVCVINDDDMAAEIYPLLRQAEVIVAASPVFFYGVTSQLKALIDRTQALWSRKYRFKLADPLKKTRKGFLLSLGGSRGKQLFDGVTLVSRYFFDAVDAKFSGSLTYRSIETRKDIAQAPTLAEDIHQAVEKIMASFQHRTKIVFMDKGNALRGQMAAAFAQYLGGDKLDVMVMGSQPPDPVHSNLAQVMAERGLDLALHKPVALETLTPAERPDLVISMAEEPDVDSFAPEIPCITWDLPWLNPARGENLRALRDQIETKVQAFLESELPAQRSGSESTGSSGTVR